MTRTIKQPEDAVPANKMGTQPIVPLLISMSLPPMTSMFLQYTYNFVDCMFVAWLSQDALTAVSLAFPIMTLILSISIGLGVGTNALIARRLGAKDQDGANNIVTHSIILSAVVGTLVTVIALMIVKPFFHAYTDDPAIYQLGLDFTNIVVFMAFGNMLHICVQKIIQATGNMVAPMLFQIAGVVLNFILDPILIFGLLGAPALGVKGAAIANVAGYSFSAILGFWVLIFRKQKVKIKIKGLRIEWRLFREIFVVGLPSLVMNALGALMVVFANIFLVAYSMTAVAFFGIYFKIQQLITMTVNGLIQGCMPVMGYNYGAKNRERLMETFRTGLVIAVIMMGFWSADPLDLPDPGPRTVSGVRRHVGLRNSGTADHECKLSPCGMRLSVRVLLPGDGKGALQPADQSVETADPARSAYVAAVVADGY